MVYQKTFTTISLSGWGAMNPRYRGSLLHVLGLQVAQLSWCRIRQPFPLIRAKYPKPGTDFIRHMMVLKQSNCYLCTSLMVVFTKQPGNPSDVITIENTLKQLQLLGITREEIVTDNGYYSKKTLLKCFMHTLASSHWSKSISNGFKKNWTNDLMSSVALGVRIPLKRICMGSRS